ncbi:hypothetical protein TrST_g6918 [Triparma strigata]|uniref:Pre-mRNA-splicing factor 38 n=1 Tax=Triparma strigata TaxID=1606541 RepID=A0A9W7EQT4_9STRA|nr:hypothetical protein TrST_g6918 [Triparma strigata]
MAPGVNTTDPLALSVHGNNPQNLLETITRQKIYACRYWKEICFGLDANGVMSKGVDLKYAGSTFGPAHQPSPFICLILKLLQISPDIDIIFKYIKQTEFKYLRVLGLFYLRLVGSTYDIYNHLETTLTDYRKFVVRKPVAIGEAQWEVRTVDDFIWELLNDEEGYVLGMSLPRLPKREVLEASHKLRKVDDKRRKSELRGDKRVKEIVKHKRRMERIEKGLLKEDDEPASKKKKGVGLFKKEKEEGKGAGAGAEDKAPKADSVEFWNEERKKLGLSELKSK